MRYRVLKSHGLGAGQIACEGDLVELPDFVAVQRITLGFVELALEAPCKLPVAAAADPGTLIPGSTDPGASAPSEAAPAVSEDPTGAGSAPDPTPVAADAGSVSAPTQPAAGAPKPASARSMRTPR